MTPEPRAAAPSHAPAQWGTTLGYGEPLTPEELAKIPIFESVSQSLMQKNFGAVVRRRFKAGDIICREGEYGSTAFYIEEGRAKVFIASPMSHIATKGESVGLFNRLRKILVGQDSQKLKETDQTRATIPIDAPVDLSLANPVAELEPGDLFGEMTCMNFYPRSATVKAVTDCTMLEMLRNILDILRKNPRFRAQLDDIYCRRALETHLRAVPFLATLTPEFIRHLSDKITLLRSEPGTVIARQGEDASDFYLIRSGFVKVSQQHAGGELVLGYLSRGDFFGEAALFGGGSRTATCTAMDHVELVKISSSDFQLILFAYPEIEKALRERVRLQQEQNKHLMEHLAAVSLDSYLSQGLMEAQSLLVLDLERCTRCDLCVRACADSHDGVTRLIREGLRFGNFLVASSCRQCRDPLCMLGCPVGSIRRRESLEVLIEDWCIGCGLCAKNCPYGNINMHPIGEAHASVAAGEPQKAAVKMKATTCDLCADLDEPSCVYACPHNAAHRVDPQQLVRIAPYVGAAPRVGQVVSSART